MSKTNLNTANVNELDDADIAALMEDAGIEEMPETEGASNEVVVDEESEDEEIVAVDETDDLADIDDLVSEVAAEDEAELEAELDKAEARADAIEQTGEVSEANVDAVKQAEPTSKAAKRTATPRQSFATCSEAVMAKIGKNYTLLGATDEAEAKQQAAAFDTLAKKVKEKVINTIDCATKGGKLSNYTQMALDLLAQKGVVTVADIKAAYKARPYSEGTANSQAHQMSQLLPALGIAVKSGSQLTLDENSPLFQALR